jgi:hypothetical protein
MEEWSGKKKMNRVIGNVCFQDNNFGSKFFFSFFADGRRALWESTQKPRYLKHIDSDFEYKKCVAKLRLRDTPQNYDCLKYPSSYINFAYYCRSKKTKWTKYFDQQMAPLMR